MGSSAVRTAPQPATAPGAADAVAPNTVEILLAREPAAGSEIGIVEAHGRRPAATLEALVGELRHRAADLGADAVRLDAIGSRFERVTEWFTYQCGTTTTEMQTRTVMSTDAQGHMTSRSETVPVTHYESKTCTGFHEVEVETMTLTGRAFRGSSAEAAP